MEFSGDFISSSAAVNRGLAGLSYLQTFTKCLPRTPAEPFSEGNCILYQDQKNLPASFGHKMEHSPRNPVAKPARKKTLLKVWSPSRLHIHGPSAPPHLLPSPYPGTEATQSPLQHLFSEDAWPANSTNTQRSSCGKWRPRREKRGLLSCLWYGGKVSCLGKKRSFKNEKVSCAT